MAENGILTQFLSENCEGNPYRLCDSIDAIPPDTNDFLWEATSPLYTKYASWGDAKEEFQDIILQSLSQPKYLLRHLIEAFKNVGRQLCFFDVGDGNIPFVGDTELYQRIKKYVPSEQVMYSQSKQSQGRMTQQVLKGLNTWYRGVVFVSLLVWGGLVYRFWRRLSGRLGLFIALMALAVFLNSAVNASLVVIADRFGAKMIWMLLLMACLLLPMLWHKDSLEDASS
jgi:hypothetical protein